MMQSLPEVELRISRGLKKLNALYGERNALKEKIHIWEEELTRLRERESELESDRANEILRKAGLVQGGA
jgi:predicted nuclease with TOPRIM domain